MRRSFWLIRMPVNPEGIESESKIGEANNPG